MKETGMMFKGPLVRAILEGRKTQTRRIVSWKGLQQGLNLGFSGLRAVKARDGWVLESNTRTSSEWRCAPTSCPVGKPGDLIYVRETWQHANYPLGPYQEGTLTFYRADYLHESDPDYADAERTIRRNWLPSIHMPKDAARIWLEITGVRVERLQDIGEEDAKAEGAPLKNSPAAHLTSYRRGFQEVWESTGGDWADNPWVWVYDFKRIEHTPSNQPR